MCTGASADCPAVVRAPTDTPCDDDNADTENDKCTAGGECVGTPKAGLCDTDPSICDDKVSIDDC